MDSCCNSRNTVAKQDDCRQKSRVYLSFLLIGFVSWVTGFVINFESDLFAHYVTQERSPRPVCSDRSMLVSVIGSTLALGFGSLQLEVSVSFSLVEKTAVLICIWTGLLQARFRRVQIVALVVIGIQAKKDGHGHAQGQSPSGPAGGTGAGNAHGNRNHRSGNRGIGGGRHGGGGHRQGHGDDDGNGGDAIRFVENGSYTRPEERAVIFLPIITGSIAYMVSLNDAELSTTGRFIRHFSMIINLVGFVCCAVVLWQPYTNPRVARLMNPRIATILSRIGSALAVLGFLSTIAIEMPIYLSWISGLAFVFLLAMFLFDMLA